MMLGREQGDCRTRASEGKGNSERHRVGRSDSTAAVRLSPLPLSSYNCCCTTGFGGREVAGPDSAREVRGFGKMRAEIAARGKGRVSTGRGGGPDGNAAARDPQSETPFGVNQVDRSPVGGVCCKNVRDDHSGVVDVETWTPKSGVNGGTEKTKHRDAANESVCCEREESRSDRQTENTHGHRGEYTAGSGHERRHENNAGMKVER